MRYFYFGSVRMIRPKRFFKLTRQNICLHILSLVTTACILWGDNSLMTPEADVSCHYVYNNYSFPVLRKNSHLPPRVIFFHETSCPANLTSRHSCAIESAALTHPEWQINVLFSGPILKDFPQFKKLRNVKFWRVHIEEFTKGRPIEQLLKNGALKSCRWADQMTTDILKYLTLSTWGGLYLDLDMVVARHLGWLVRNWATRDDNDVAEGIMALSKYPVGKILSESAVTEMTSIFLNGYCNSKRPRIMKSVLLNFCSNPDVGCMSSATCNGFEVYGPQFFHPIPENRARDYFTPGEIVVDNAYTYHLWEQVTKEYKVMKGSPYSKLAQRYCPSTFKLYSDQFGA